MIDLADLVRGFAALLRRDDDNIRRLDEQITSARAADLPHLHAFTRGLDIDRAAVNAAVSLPYSNGGAEGVNTATKRIMRQIHGRAGFPCSATASCSPDTLSPPKARQSRLSDTPEPHGCGVYEWAVMRSAPRN